MAKYHRKHTGSVQTALLILLALVTIGMGVFLWMSDRQIPAPEEEHGSYNDRIFLSGDTLEWQGVHYRLRPNITPILVMGIDPDTERNSELDFRHGGQADFLQLVILDHSNNCISRLEINRDTMTDITTLTVLGEKSGTRQTQICLSHGFGDGKEQSCELTVDAVNGLLGTNLSWYYALNLNGVEVLNEQVGGVEVTVTDDLSALDPALTPGAVLTLHGRQVQAFVRSRMSVADGTNVNRMNRQREYMKGLSVKLKQLAESGESAIAGLFDVLDPYVVTNLAKGKMVNEIWRARNYTLGESIQIEGTFGYDEDGYTAFYPDRDRLTEAVLELLYEPIK